MDSGYLIGFYILISTLPGIFLATKKYFLIIQNPKYNRFIIKLFYFVPSMTVFTLILSLLPWAVYRIFLYDYSQFLIDKFTIYIALLCPLSASIFLIYIFRKYVVRTDLPPEFRPDFMDHKLYVFMPHSIMIDPFQYHTKYIYPKKRDSDELLIGKQVGNLIFDFKILRQINYTITGEVIVNENTLEIFQKYDLTGYQTQPVTDYNKPPSHSGIFYQIIPMNTMPPFSPKTIIRVKRTPKLRVFVRNDIFYYNADVMDNVFDFNATSEILGSHDRFPYSPQKLWIVSKKVMIVLLKECGCQKRDFIPVMLVGGEKED